MSKGFNSQLETYHALCDFIKTHGHSPTMPELAYIRGLSVCVIHRHVRHLEWRGYVYKVAGWRNVRLAERNKAA